MTIEKDGCLFSEVVVGEIVYIRDETQTDIIYKGEVIRVTEKRLVVACEKPKGVFKENVFFKMSERNHNQTEITFSKSDGLAVGKEITLYIVRKGEDGQAELFFDEKSKELKEPRLPFVPYDARLREQEFSVYEHYNANVFIATYNSAALLRGVLYREKIQLSKKIAVLYKAILILEEYYERWLNADISAFSSEGTNLMVIPAEYILSNFGKALPEYRVELFDLANQFEYVNGMYDEIYQLGQGGYSHFVDIDRKLRDFRIDTNPSRGEKDAVYNHLATLEETVRLQSEENAAYVNEVLAKGSGIYAELDNSMLFTALVYSVNHYLNMNQPTV